jgi:HK97 family phage major capsid protein
MRVVQRADEPIEFDIADMVRSVCAESWRSSNRQSSELRISSELAERYKRPITPAGGPIPGTALLNRAQLMDTKISSGAGGYVVDGHQVVDALPALRPQSVCMRLGAQAVTTTVAGLSIPYVTSGPTTSWQAVEGGSLAESGLTFGLEVAVPRLMNCTIRVSRQLLLQSNAGEAIRRELVAEAARQLDIVAIGGDGTSGKPTGLLYRSPASFSSSQLTQTDLRLAQRQVLDAGGEDETTAFVADVATAYTLSRRQRVASSDRMLWEGKLANGIVEGATALATANVPTNTIVYGAWSAVHIVQWQTLELLVDPFTEFSRGVVAIQLSLPCDVLIPRAASCFSAASGTL